MAALPLMTAYFNEIQQRIRNEEEDDELVMTIMAEASTEKTSKRTCVKGYFESVIRNYTDDDFKSHFRMRRSTFEELLTILTPYLCVDSQLGRPSVPVEKQLLVALWILATPDSNRSVGDRFNLARSTVSDIRMKMISILTKISPKFITWPTGDRIKATTDGFLRFAGFPGVIGSIDGTHISIQAPSHHPEAYFNRKKFYSVILQATCDHRMIFTDCFCGFPGSTHDARVFRRSPLKQSIDENPSKFFDHETHMLGDAAYPLHLNLMTPYKETGHLSQKEKEYNVKHSKTRCVIERSFAQLKGRFRRLKHLEMFSIERIPHFILSCCVLHNICILKKDIIETSEDCEDDCFPDDESLSSITTTNDAIRKRQYLSDVLL